VKPGSGLQHLWEKEKESEATPRTTPGVSGTIPEPSYHGPGAQFEKDEEYLTQDTAAPPTEEELDVLDT
jgi:glycogenin glucosyltransferase